MFPNVFHALQVTRVLLVTRLLLPYLVQATKSTSYAISCQLFRVLYYLLNMSQMGPPLGGFVKQDSSHLKGSHSAGFWKCCISSEVFHERRQQVLTTFVPRMYIMQCCTVRLRRLTILHDTGFRLPPLPYRSFARNSELPHVFCTWPPKVLEAHLAEALAACAFETRNRGGGRSCLPWNLLD